MLRRVPSIVVDTLLALFFVGLTVVEVVASADDGITAGSPTATLLVLCPFCSFLVLRRRSPLLCFGLMHGWYVLCGLVTAHSGFAFATSVPSLIVTYTVARYADRRWRWIGLTSGPLFWLGTALADGTSPKVLSSIWFAVVTTIIAWGTGRLLGRLSDGAETLRRAREQLVAEQARREAAVVTEERARIALEMHDVVSDSVARMVTALAQESSRLGAAGDDVRRLDAAQEAGRRALAEMHETVRSWRPEGIESLPSLVDAADLVAHYRGAGLEVTWSASQVGRVAPGVSFAAYRILQEALTNALKHGGGAAVVATVRQEGEDVVVEVRNRLLPETGPGRHPSGRHGLLGMRERVGAFGGSLRAGVDGDEFAVRAALPLRPMVAVAGQGR